MASNTEHDAIDRRNEEQGPQEILEDGPIIIKGGSVSVRYKRTSFETDPSEPQNTEKHKSHAVLVSNVKIVNKDVSPPQTLFNGPPGRSCEIEIKYE